MTGRSENRGERLVEAATRDAKYATQSCTHFRVEEVQHGLHTSDSTNSQVAGLFIMPEMDQCVDAASTRGKEASSKPYDNGAIAPGCSQVRTER